MKMNILAGKAGDRFLDGIRLTEEDGRFGLKYVLLRLELVGLTELDRRNLKDLIVTACKNQDVTESADRVRKAESASLLAMAIADIVQKASSHRKEAALGAVLGAHGTVSFRSVGDPIEGAIAGAIAGAVAASSIALIDGRELGFGFDEFLVERSEAPGRV